MMGRMASETSDVVTGVGRAQEVGVLVAVGMASQTSLARFFRAQLLERNNFRDVATGFHVRGPRPVTILTSVLSRLNQRVMRCVLKTFVVDLFVARLAGVSARVTRLLGTLPRRRGHRLIAGRTLRRG